MDNIDDITFEKFVDKVRRFHFACKDRIGAFFDEIRENVSKELVDDDDKCRKDNYVAYFYFNMEDDKELYEKLINYLDSKNIEYDVYTDYDGSKDVKVDYEQFYVEVYDKFFNGDNDDDADDKD